eukprot:scaffold277191_cov18-Tisochrysis_lutea.AAC.1
MGWPGWLKALFFGESTTRLRPRDAGGFATHKPKSASTHQLDDALGDVVAGGGLATDDAHAGHHLLALLR